MTKDEAAEMIKDDMRLHHDYLSGTYRKALNMAIDALKRDEIINCENCNRMVDEVQFMYCLYWNEVTYEGDYCSRARRKEE